MPDASPGREDLLKKIPGHDGFYVLSHKTLIDKAFLDAAGENKTLLNAE